MGYFNKERILLVAALGVCGTLYVLGARGAGASGPVKPGAEKAAAAEPLAAPGYPFAGAAAAPGRDIFQRPTESEPLAPLSLAPPPRDELPLVAPVPIPGPGPDGFFVLRHSGEILPTPPGLESPAAEEPAAAAQPPAAEPAPKGPEERQDPQDQALLRQRYDWIVDRANNTHYGFILNEGRFDLKLPLDKEQGLTIRAVNPRTGVSTTTYTVQGDRVARFGFAETVANWIEIGKRALPRGQAYDQDRRQFIHALLEKAEESPEALQEAARQAEILVADSKDAPASWETMARVHARSGELEKEFLLYQRASTEFRDRAFVRIGLGKIYQRLTLMGEAEAEFRRALQLEPSWESHMALGGFLLQAQRYSEALPVLQRAIQLAPADSKSRFEIRYQVASALLGLGQAQEAGEEARRAREAGFETPLLDLLDGLVLLCGGKAPEALEPLARAVEALPDRAEPGLALGIASGLAGKHAEALAALEAAGARDPLIRPRGLGARAWVLRRVGLGGEALAALEAGLRMAPDDPYLLYLAGRVRREAGDVEGARTALTALMRRHPAVPEILMEMARVELEDEALLRAENYASRALELAGARADTQWEELLGDIFLMLKRTSEAEDVFQRAVKRNRSPHARIGLAQAAYYRGEVEDSVDQLRRMIEGGEFPAGDPWLLFAQDLHDRIVGHALKEQVVDDFQRQEVGLRWKLQKYAQAAPRIQDGVLLLQGPLDRERVLGAMRENEEARLFVSVEVECKVLPGHLAEAAGVRLGVLRQVGRSLKAELDPEIALWWDSERGHGLVQVTGTRTRTEEERRPQPIPVELWPLGETVRIRVEYSGPSGRAEEAGRGILRILVAEQLVRSMELPELGRATGKLQIELFARGKAGERANLQFDNFRLIRRKEDK